MSDKLDSRMRARKLEKGISAALAGRQIRADTAGGQRRSNVNGSLGTRGKPGADVLEQLDFRIHGPGPGVLAGSIGDAHRGQRTLGRRHGMLDLRAHT
jgi:hypothetical protein